MIRSFFTLLAALTLMLVALTASAVAMRMDDGHLPQMQTHGAVASETGTIPACDGMGDLSCAFACAGMARPLTPERLPARCVYGVALFFVVSAPFPARYGPELAERPPRLR